MLSLQGGRWEISEKEGQWTQVVRRNTKALKEREQPPQIMNVKNTGTSSTSDYHARSPEHIYAQVVSGITYEPPTSGDESDSTITDSGIYCRV